MSTDDPTPLSGQRVRHGTGVQSNRAFPTDEFPRHLDPFVLFEQFYIDPEQGFPMHEHRGFEIVSYMIEGGMAHEDSLGVTNTASESDAMRITAGESIRHAEFPADGEACTGLQLWVNLPRAEKDVEPDYVDASADELPTVERDGTTVTTVVGEGSPIDLHTPMEYLDASVTDAWTWTVPEDWVGFLYGVSGRGAVDGHAFSDGDVLPLPDESAREIEVRADESLRVAAVSGRPHDEPIQQRGPFVL
ncbi:MAG: pirin family protein [Halobacteriaceae archaeon]